jgi:hypothetical protein
MKKIVLIILTVLLPVAAAFGGQKDPYILGHITTCSGLINNYPADSTNWFYRQQHTVVQYFAYFLFPSSGAGGVSGAGAKNKYYLFINPYVLYSRGGAAGTDDTDNFSFENKWVSPSGKTICEKVLSWAKSSSDKRVSVEDRQYVPYAFANFIGINQTFTENGQDGLPSEKGLYHIDIFVNGELAAITFFEMKD